MTKYAVIGALFALLFLLIYSRLRPYIELLRKISRAMTGALDANSQPSSTPRSGSTKTENKLVRCVACGTWVPTDRAVGSTAGFPVYCSRDCIENSSSGKNRKMAG